ncbi:MAG: AvrE-family type 3 secretion system effector, partial [Pseudomonas sp.]|nr:AvrE-family type 3 secretion system effector [Pseudomonas sp.]
AENKLIAHVNGKARVLTFTRPKELVALALDRQGDLYAQTGAGELLKLDKAHWQTPCTSALTWTPVPVPDNAPVKSLRMGAGQQLIVSWGENNAQQKRWGEHYRQLIVSADGDPQWKPLTAHSNTPARSLGTVLGNAELKSQDNGTSWAVTSDCFGHKTEALSVDRGVIKSALAHFHPVQGIKNIGLGIQHDVKGRRGLADLYADVRELQGLLRTLASVTPRTMDISSRLDRLGEGKPTQALATKLKRFLSEVEECSVQLARRLGEIKGARVIPDYLPTTSGKPTEGSASNLSRIRQSFENMGSSKSDITAALLRSYEKQGVCLSLHDAGLKRDLSNSTGLIESDLIQHARTLFRLVKLVDRLEGKAPDQAEITARLESAIEDYQSSPVHKKTSQNINGLKQAETLYNNFKLLARDLGTPGSALNFHITTTLGLNPQETVKQALLQCIQKSESGQSVASSRSKTLSASLFLLPVPLLEIIGGVSRDNTNGITLTRTDQGVSVDINMGTGHTVTGSVGVGNMLLPSEVPLEGRLRVGAETTLALTHENEQSVSFDIREADFPAMMAILTGEKGNVFDLLDLGSNHKSGTSSKNALDLSVSAHVQPRFHMLMPETSNTPGGLVRTMVNAGGGLQLFHVDQRSAVVLGQDEITRAQSVNTQWLARGSASLGMAPANGALWTQLGADGPTWVPYITSDSSFTLGFDRSVARSMRFTFKQPAVIDQAQVNGLRDALSRHSAPLKQHLTSFAAQGPLVEQLQHLHRLFIQLPSPATRSEEHHALNEQLQTCLHQEALAAQGRRALKSVERTVSYVAVKGGPEHEWLNDAAPANKAAILRLFAQQPQFERIINDLESSQGTSVVIRLEVKPKVLRMIDNQIGDGPNAINDVQKALENPDNLRIKTLAVSYTATRTDAMKTPIPLVAYSSRAALSNSCKLLNIELKYGMDQNTPLRVEFKDTLPSARIRELNPEQLDQKIRHGRSPLM